MLLNDTQIPLPLPPSLAPSSSISSSYLKINIDNNLRELGIKQNYTSLLHELERLANSITPEIQSQEIHSVISSNFTDSDHFHKIGYDDDVSNDLVSHQNVLTSDAEYSRFISDIWIGIVLTLLIMSIIFFICSCFLYHKFQQWKNSYRTAHSEPEIIRRYELDVESLPSYTLVSGLPTYDDALEQFRKSRILISQPSVIKIFEEKSPLSTFTNGIKTSSHQTIEGLIKSTRNESIMDDNKTGNKHNFDISDSISMNSCSCGASTITTSIDTATDGNGSIASCSTYNDHPTQSCSTTPSTSIRESTGSLSTIASVIELNPEQLKILSQKRLSLQIALSPPVQVTSSSSPSIPLSNRYGNNNGVSHHNGKIDLCRELLLNRSNLLRSHDIPQVHRSAISLSFYDSPQNSMLEKRLKRLKHRGSLA